MQGDAHAISGRAVAPTSCSPDTPTLMLEVENPHFALCFLSNPRQCILHTSCGEECCGRNVSLCSRSSGPEGSVGCAGNLCPQQGLQSPGWGQVVLSGGNSLSVPKRIYEEAVPTSGRCPSGIQEFMGIPGQNELCGARDVEWDEAHFPLLRAP